MQIKDLKAILSVGVCWTEEEKPLSLFVFILYTEIKAKLFVFQCVSCVVSFFCSTKMLLEVFCAMLYVKYLV